MHTSHLGEDILAHNGLVGRNDDAGTCLHQMRHLAKLFLVDMSIKRCLVGKYCLHTRQRGIACTLAKTIHCCMNALASCLCRCQDICHGKIIVVVGMKVEMHIGIACHHLTDIKTNLHGVEHAQGVGQHETLDGSVLQTVHQGKDIVGRVLDTI